MAYATISKPEVKLFNTKIYRGYGSAQDTNY